MPTRASYDYAVLRIVPRVDREEFINAGVVLHCFERSYLAAACDLNVERLAAFAPEVDPEVVRRHLDAVARICRGDRDAGPIGKLPPKERFRWLVAPRSTIIQPSPVHAGLCEDPAGALEHLVNRMVRMKAAR